MEEIVKELREDKKRAWEMITCLNERLSKAEKQGKDEDLHNKMDKILENLLDFTSKGKDEQLYNTMGKSLGRLENQAKLEKKLDILADKIEHLAEEVTKSKEMMKVIDTVETAVGYAELFVKDFDKIHGKMAEIDAKIEDARQLDIGILGKIHEIESLIEKAYQFEHIEDAILREIERMKEDIKGNIGVVIPQVLQEIQKGNERMNSLTDLKRQTQTISTALVSQKVDIDQLKRELAETAKKPKATYKCYNSNCHTELPKHLVLREDGVSVVCPNVECRMINIIDKLEEGHKWMSIFCNNEWHYQQFPLNKTANVTKTCRICGKQGIISDEKCLALLVFENTDDDLRKNIGASQFVKTTEKINSELRNKCLNSNCNFTFPINIKLLEDGVSVVCPDNACRRYNIVGSLKEGNRWGFMSCNGKTIFNKFRLK